MPGPPPPPPLPGMGRGGGGPPPPPGPPPPGGLPSKKATKGAGRGALLNSIESGTRLKKVGVVNDRSAPVIDKKESSAAPAMGAPPVPGMSRPGAAPPAPPGLAPPAPNRARSNSDGGDTGSGGGPPQLAGLLAGGIPKLRKTGGAGIDTGAERSSPYMSDPESNRRPPGGAPPRPPGAAPRVPGGAPPPPPGAAPSAPVVPSVASLRGNLRSASHSMVDISSKPKPPPPGKKPPLPTARKPSGLAPPPPPSSAPSPPSAPPLPPSAPAPPSRSTPPPPPGLPPSAPNGAPSLAAQAARNAFGRSASASSPSAAPPPPPPPPPGAAPTPPALSSRISSVQDDQDEYDPYNYQNPSAAPSQPPPAPALPPPRPSAAAPSAPAPPPPPPPSAPSRALTQSATKSMLDIHSPPSPPSAPPPPASAGKSLPSLLNTNASSYTLTNGSNRDSRAQSVSSPPVRSPGITRVQDARWKFQEDSALPPPRGFSGIQKRYRAGRVSSVPLDLSAYQ